jgi:hypothetical protein
MTLNYTPRAKQNMSKQMGSEKESPDAVHLSGPLTNLKISSDI